MQQTPLSQGNAALRNKDYEAAIRHYNRALAQHPELAAMLQSNIDLAHQRGGIPKPATGAVPVATVDIVVPVYNALEDVKKCLESLQRCTDGLTVKVIVVNDGSDEATTQWLREYCGGKPVFKLIEHERNAGYTKAVNTGLKATTADYAITQNSDTIVSPGWLTGLIRCMNSSPTIGIAGPLSNAAGWQTVPNLRDDDGNFAVNELPAGYTVEDMARIVQKVSVKAYPRLPLINGFCFMIKRSVINRIGYIDEDSFPIGYGEENDYCIRATDAGYELAVADDVFVFHSKSKSFGHDQRKKLSKEGNEALRKKYSTKITTTSNKAQSKTEALNRVRTAIQHAISFNKNNQHGSSKNKKGSIQKLMSAASPDNENQTFSNFKLLHPDRLEQVAVVVHYYYPEIWKEIEKSLIEIKYPFQLFITSPTDKLGHAEIEVRTSFPNAIFFDGPNLGMDIVPFINAAPKIHDLGYAVICKIQTKRGVDQMASVWREVMLDTLIGSNHNFHAAATAFTADSNLCMIGPASLYQSGPRLMLGNRESVEILTKNLFKKQLPESEWGFFAGTMFWVRSAALLDLAKHVDYKHPALTKEYKQDGKIEHALERLFGLIPKLTGKKIGLMHPTRNGFKECVIAIHSAEKYINEMGVGAQLRQISTHKADAAIIKESNLFDEALYLRCHPEIGKIGADPLFHYLTHGHHKGSEPTSNTAELKKISNHLKITGDLRLPLLVYAEGGETVRKILNPAQNELIRKATKFNIETVRESGLFDFEFYRSQFPTTPHTGTDLLQHYYETGSYDEMFPNKWFIPREYRKLNPDIVEAGFDALYHYLAYGAKECRRYRENKVRQEQESPFYRYMNLNATLVDWKHLEEIQRSDDIVSIVIPIYDQHELTEKCLLSIFSVKNDCSFEVICVDNGSGKEVDDLLQQYARQHPNVITIKNGENYNFALGCNIGFSKAHGKRIVFLNNDTTVTDHWLDNLLEPLNDLAVAAVQPKLLYPDGTIQNMGIVFGLFSPFGYPIYENLSSHEPVTLNQRKCQAVTAACIAIRAVDFIHLRGFDPIYINGQEDVDLCLRLTNKTNRYCMVQTNSTVFHHESKTKGRGKYIALNRRNFLSRWGSLIEYDDVYHYKRDGYQLTGYLLDSDEMEAAGTPIRRPIIRKFSENGKIIPKYKDTKKITPFRFFPKSSYDEYSDLTQFAVIGSAPLLTEALTVCLISHASGTELYGSERSFLDMLSAVNQLECNIIVCFPERPSRDYLEKVLSVCTNVYVFPYTHWHSETGSRLHIIKLFEYIYHTESIDVVYVNTIMMKEASDASNNINIPVITHVRELIAKDDTLRAHIGLSTENIIRNVYDRSSMLVCNSNATAAMFPDKKKIVVARNIINSNDFDLENMVLDSSVRFGLISSNVPKKGVRDFFEIASICKWISPLSKFCLIGPINDFVKDLAKEFDVEQNGANLEILGYLPDNIDAVSKVNVVLSLSHFDESFGRTIAEGLAAYRPALAYARGAVPELIIDNENGFLVPPGDVKRMAACIKRISDSPNLVNEFGKRGNEVIKQLCAPEQLTWKLAKSFALALISSDGNKVLRSKLERHLDKNPTEWVNFLNGFIRPVSVIIPVFNAFEHVRNLVSAIKSTSTPPNTRFIFINDGSTDPRICELFSTLEISDECNFRVYNNDKNIGYTATINRGIFLAGRDDVILLNSDTIVTPSWIHGLKSSAYLSKNVGTVTSMSDNAGVFSFPIAGIKNSTINNVCNESHAEMVVTEASKLDDIRLPTGNGFCLYIKRDLVDHIGVFDILNFPRGYGEENDFCMRANASGFFNMLCTSSFVFHVKSASFESQRDALIKSGADALNRLHPEYTKLVSEFFGGGKINSLRDAIRNLY